MKKIVYFLVAIGMISAWTACDADLWELKDNNKGAYVESERSPISSTLEEDENFSEWVKVLNYSETFSVLNAMYGSSKQVKFTHFAPNNEAMQTFYAAKGVSGIEDLGKAYAAAMVQTMTYSGDSLKLTEKFTASVEKISLNSVADERLSIIVDIDEPGFLMVNASGKSYVHIARRYKECSNGFYYEANGVLSPLIEMVSDRVSAENSSIMKAALEATGYDKELSIAADTTYLLGSCTIIPRAYTLFNVTDSVYAAAGIHSLADLKAALTARASDPTVGQDSLLKQYIQYHLMDGSYNHSALLETNGSDTVRIWNTMAKNQIMMISKTVAEIQVIDSITADTTFVLYLNTADIEGQRVDRATSNVMAKNGYVHNVMGWMPVYEPKPTTVVWDLTDYPDVRNLLYKAEKPYQPANFDKEEFTSVQNAACYTVELGPDGKGPADFPALAYATCKNNLKNCVNNDRLLINVGYMGSVTLTTPTIAKGKYKVSISVAYLTNHADIKNQKNCKGGMMRLTVDGENEILSSPYTTITSSATKVYSADLYEEIEFTETNSHSFKFLVLDPAASTSSKFTLQFDAITFTPIE